MKVYIVYCEEADSEYLIKIFDSLEKAENAIKELEATNVFDVISEEEYNEEPAQGVTYEEYVGHCMLNHCILGTRYYLVDYEVF